LMLERRCESLVRRRSPRPESSPLSHRNHAQDRTCSGHMCEFSPGALSEARGGVGWGGAGGSSNTQGRQSAHARTLTGAAMYPLAMYLLGPLVPRVPTRQRVIQVHHLLFESPWFEVCISEPVCVSMCMAPRLRGASGWAAHGAPLA